MDLVSRFALLLLLVASLPAQDSPAAIRGVVLSDSGRPLAQARLLFLPDPGIGLGWLPDPPIEAPPSRGLGDSRGRFRITAGAATGCLSVEHDGLGAVLPRVSAGEILPIALQPMAELRYQDDAEFEAALLLLRQPSDPIALPARRGNLLRLPAGDYLMLARRGDGRLTEHRLRLAAGERRLLAVPEGSGPILRGSDSGDRQPGDSHSGDGEPGDGDHGVSCSLLRWPSYRFEGQLPLLTGPARLRIVHRSRAGAEAVSDLWIDGDETEIAIPDASPRWRPARVIGLDGHCPPRTVLYSVSTTPGGGVMILGIDRSAADGQFSARADRPTFAEEVGLVALAPGHAPSFCRLPDDDSIPTLELRPARQRSFRVLDSSGQPLSGADVHIEVPGAPLLSRSLTSDALGLVRIPLAPGGELRLRISDATHLPQDLVLPEAGEDLPQFTLLDGLRLRGRLVDRQGRPLAGVAILLRSTSGSASGGDQPRVTTSRDDGSFEFDGLSSDLYMVSARLERDGQTWSGQVRAQPGPDEWQLMLSSEDPPLPEQPR